MAFALAVRVRVSVFLQEGRQRNDGSFRFAPNNRLYKGKCDSTRDEHVPVRGNPTELILRRVKET